MEGTCEQTRVYAELLVNICLQRWGPGCLSNWFLRDQKKQASLETQGGGWGGAAKGGLSQKFSEIPIPLSGSGDLLSEDFWTPR